MRGFTLYYFISLLTGNPFIALIALILIYALIDRFYIGLLPDLSRVFNRNQQIRSYLNELKFNPENARASYSLGVLYFEKKKYQDAQKFLEHPRLKNDSTANYYNYLGMTLIELDRIDEGEKNIIRGLEIDPQSVYGLPYVYLLRTQMRRKIPDSTRTGELEQKIGRFGNTENLFRTGMIYKRTGNTDKAREFFHKALVEYSYCPRGIKRIHRKWAILSKIQARLF